MKILLTMNLPYTRVHGGANKSNKSMLEDFAKTGYEVKVVTPALATPSSITIEELLADLNSREIKFDDKNEYYLIYINNVEVLAVKDDKNLKKVLEAEIKGYLPDWVFVSSEDPSQSLLQAVLELSPNNIIYIAHSPMMLPFGPDSLYPGEKRTKMISKVKKIVSISQYTADYIREWSGNEVIVNHPSHYGQYPFKKAADFNNEFILMVNPCAVKGISILISLAKYFPKQKFAVIPGWGTTLSDIGRMKELHNITIMKPTSDLDTLFKKVKILLMPSLIPEGFGMIVIDAMVRGIPVISSDLGGLKEAKLGTRYSLKVIPISKYLNKFDENYFPKTIVPEQDLTAWKEAFEELLKDKSNYIQQSQISMNRAIEFVSGLSNKPLENYLSSNKRKLNLKLENLTLEQKKRLFEKLRRKKIEEKRYKNRITPLPKMEYYDVSHSQKQLLIIDELTEGFNGSNIPTHLILKGKLNKDLLKETFNVIIDRHESFRTIFKKVEGNYKQKILDHADVSMDIKDLRNNDNKTVDAQNILKEVYDYRFDLYNDMLLKIKLLQLENDENLLIIVMHHVISDGWSMEIFIQEVFQVYNSLIQGNKINLKPLEFQYKDYAKWQERHVLGDEYSEHKEYWHSKLKGELPILNLPLDRSRPQLKSYNGARYEINLTKEQLSELYKICRSNNSTIFMALTAITKILLYNYSGQDDIIVGTPVSGRQNNNLSGQIGYYVNMLPLRDIIIGEESFLKFLNKVKTTNTKAYNYEDYPFDCLVDELVKKRDMSRSPIFDIMVLYSKNNEENNSSRSNVDALTFKGFEINDESIGSSHDMAFQFKESEGDLSIGITYNTDLFDKDRIIRLGNHFNQVVDQVIKDQNIIIDQINLLTDEESKELLAELNQEDVIYPEQLTIHEQFEKIVERYPNKIACKIRGDELTYNELNTKANQLAYELVRNGVSVGDIVAIVEYRSIQMIIDILAILKSGGAYLPIDPNFPKDRIEFTISDSKCKSLLTSEKILEDLKIEPDVNIIKSESDHISNNAIHNLNSANSSQDLAYIIYTSGSTGKPKGVMVQHNNVIRLLFNEKSLYDFNENDIWTLFHSFSFDFSVWEMYGALLNGGKVVIVPKETTQNPNEFIKLIIQEKITILNQVPGAFYNLNNDESLTGIDKLELRYVIFGGDKLNPSKLRYWKEKFPSVKFVNMFGITETTVHVTYKELLLDDMKDDRSNIGKPIPTLKTLVLDKNRKLLPLGVAGELCISGAGVSRGYLDRDDLTKEKFIKNPFKKNDKLYCSGDLVRYLTNGDLEYLGRIDDQIQLRGFRIELGEIEEVLKNYPKINNALVCVQEINGEKHICAYLICDKEADIDVEINFLKEFLKKELPSYMVPSFFIEIEEIPLTVNGKINKKVLPVPEETFIRSKDYVAPSSEQEKKLVEVWETVLGIENIGIEDNFFEIGGHSLKAIEVISLIYKEFNIEIPLGEFYEATTIREIAKIITTILWNKNDEENTNEVELVI